MIPEQIKELKELCKTFNTTRRITFDELKSKIQEIIPEDSTLYSIDYYTGQIKHLTLYSYSRDVVVLKLGKDFVVDRKFYTNFRLTDGYPDFGYFLDYDEAVKTSISIIERKSNNKKNDLLKAQVKFHNKE